MSVDTLFGRLAGAWVAVGEASERTSNGVPARVAGASAGAVEAAVHGALRPFLLGDDAVPPLRTACTETGWEVQVGGVTVVASAHRVEVDGRVDEWTLDASVASSIARETVRNL
ncbi:MAG: hypothetical protein ACOH2Q_17655, partial [Rhodococcus sp. (in: high G+C Gram-positive bacteria)]